MRIIRKITSRLGTRAIWALTLTAFAVFSVFAVAFGVNAVKGGEMPSPKESYYDHTEDYIGEAGTDPAVGTKAPNTGDSYMTTKIIEYTYYPEDTTDNTPTVKGTDSQTIASVTTSAGGISEPGTMSNDPAVLLVNPWNPLHDGYLPELVSIGNGQQADVRVKDALEAMLADCRKAGYNPLVCSSYRTIERQRILFENETKIFMSYGYNRDEAEELAAKWVARPGTSEHHTGLAFDIVSLSYQKLDRSQENTPEQKWLMANCHNYGFILRYPDDKTDITGINYEPWHYRYVGFDAAAEIMESGICFEEYLSSN